MTTDELRARVATEVMGWTLEIVNSVDSFHWWCAPEGAICKAGDWRPDTDPRDRDMVVEAMWDRGWMISINRVGVSPPYHVEFRRGARRHSCSDHMGYAIMRAALAAVEDGCEPSET